MITAKEIANICGVSPSTVSNILNGKPNVSEETRQKVWQVVRETGYQPNYFAANMRKRSTRTIGIVAEDLGQFSTTPILESAMAYCDENDYRTIIMNLRLYDKWKDTWYDDEEKVRQSLVPVLNELQSIKVDGVIYIAGHGRVIHCLPQDFPLPTMIAYAISDNDRMPSVILDDEQGGYNMTNYLLGLGHKKIAVIAGVKDNMHTQERMKGCRKALNEAGLSLQDQDVFFGDWERDSGNQGAQKFCNGDYSAIWCMNDLMAAGVYDFARQKKIEIGKDITVIGYDNRQVAGYLYPGLTTSDLPLKEIGIQSAQILIGMLEKKSFPDPKHKLIKVGSKMVLRNSAVKMK